MIISLGYRVKSAIATRFRRWATERLKEYIVKGFSMDDERLKKLGGGNYWKDLLNRIRDIRSLEKVMYSNLLIFMRRVPTMIQEVPNPMYMSDYVEHFDEILQSTGEKLLVGYGKVSHAMAI